IIGEGKSSTSMNLSIVLAKQGRRVLLIDADLRRPSIHKAMRLSATDGLSTILRMRNKAQERMNGFTPTSNSVFLPAPGIPNLFVVPAGSADPEPAELVASSAMQE